MASVMKVKLRFKLPRHRWNQNNIEHVAKKEFTGNKYRQTQLSHSYMRSASESLHEMKTADHHAIHNKVQQAAYSFSSLFHVSLLLSRHSLEFITLITHWEKNNEQNEWWRRHVGALDHNCEEIHYKELYLMGSLGVVQESRQLGKLSKKFF